MSTSVSAFFQRGLPFVSRVAENEYASTGKWLLATGGFVVTMINVGGVTRLTQSGLSMTTWHPLGGLPPLNKAEWDAEFARYKTFPEWEQRKNMTMDEFQYIYAWEYGHRMLGRGIGLFFCVPWAYFSYRGRIPPGYQKYMAALAGMGATQGLVGWWMVKSGLGEDRRGDRKEIRVRPSRLATHLTMAVATYGALLWTGFNVLSLPHNRSALQLSQLSELATKFPEAFRQACRLRMGAVALTHLSFVTIVSGAFVAGNDAGRAYNTFPQMDGVWIPDEMWALQPWYSNLVENTATVQFNHRVLATTTFLTAVTLVGVGLVPHRVALLTPQVRSGLYAVGASVAGQYVLGISTLLNYVPISLAVAHQFGSIVVFTSGVYLVHALRYAAPSVRRALAKVPEVLKSTL